MATHIASRTRSPGCGAPSANPEEIMRKSPATATPCHKPTSLPTPKPPTKPPNLLFPSEDPIKIASSDEST
eukprot:7176453-Ditylum_brightwellii.AAC.1